MLRLLSYLIGKGVVTEKVIPSLLDAGVVGLPKVTEHPCSEGCNACVEICPTNAVLAGTGSSIAIDRGACIGCNQCVEVCPTETLVADRNTAVHGYRREDLIVAARSTGNQTPEDTGIFKSSLAVRVVSTGCAACDLELGAANNPIFDMERFGISVVASPRFADALVVTGPVPLSMHEPLRVCYESMAAPRIVIACGTCAISGGVHEGGYTQANGVGAILPVDLFIPGCPPHPWQLIQGLLAARRLKGL